MANDSTVKSLAFFVCLLSQAVVRLTGALSAGRAMSTDAAQFARTGAGNIDLDGLAGALLLADRVPKKTGALLRLMRTAQVVLSLRLALVEARQIPAGQGHNGNQTGQDGDGQPSPAGATGRRKAGRGAKGAGSAQRRVSQAAARRDAEGARVSREEWLAGLAQLLRQAAQEEAGGHICEVALPEVRFVRDLATNTTRGKGDNRCTALVLCLHRTRKQPA